MRKLKEPIDAPELGVDTDGLVGLLVRVPRQTSFQADPDGCIRERREIIEWCHEQGIRLAKIDMARARSRPGDPIRAFPTLQQQEWEVFIEGGDREAVIFKVRWA